jgi:tryptophan synthase alpha chain
MNLKSVPKLGIYATLGDFGLENSLAILQGAAQGGASLLEVGIPFSDPLLDGSVICASHERALKNLRNEQKKREDLLEAILHLRSIVTSSVQISLMLCSQLLYDEFWLRALSFIDGILVTDLQSYSKSKFDLHSKRVWFVTESSLSLNEGKNFPEPCSMVYLARVQGVTGVRGSEISPLQKVIAKVTNATSAPIWTGFGISKWQDVLDDWNSGAIGGIVGSLFVHELNLFSDSFGETMPSAQEFRTFAKMWVQKFQGM